MGFIQHYHWASSKIVVIVNVELRWMQIILTVHYLIQLLDITTGYRTRESVSMGIEDMLARKKYNAGDMNSRLWRHHLSF